MIRLAIIGSKYFGEYIQNIKSSQMFPDVSLNYCGDTLEDSITVLAGRVAESDSQVLLIGPNDYIKIREYINIPYYIVNTTLYDFLTIHEQIDDYPTTAVVIRRVHNIDMSLLEKALHVKYNKFIYEYNDDVYSLIVQLKQQGYKTIVGVQFVVEMARSLGLNAIYYYTQPNLEIAVRNAIQIAQNMEKERDYLQEIQSILENSMCGAVCLSYPDLNIVYANATSLNMLRCRLQDMLQKNVEEMVSKAFFAGLSAGLEKSEVTHFDFYGVPMVGTVVPLRLRGKISRLCILFENASSILQYETIIRQEIKRKSFSTHYTFRDILGSSEEIKRAILQAKQFAKSQSTILINGETGAGKEVFAQSIHELSPRRNYPFVAINCAAMPDTLIESELFGYMPGSFTGASKNGKTGLIELANHGTVFLDDIDALSPNFQAKLLRVMQEKEIIRVGGNAPIPVDVRFIVATNRNLKQLVKQEKFRNDLYFRVNVLHLYIPPLRKRPEDVLILFNHYLEHFSREIYEELQPIIPQVAEPLLSYTYPGNIRELVSITERFVTLIDNSRLEDANYLKQLLRYCLEDDRDTEDLLLAENEGDRECAKAEKAPLQPVPQISGDFKADLAEAEQQILNAYYQDFSGNMTQLAQKLGISRATLYNKLGKKQGSTQQ